MNSEQREELERRVLALLRRQLDVMDELNPEGLAFGDFVLTGRFWAAPELDANLNPWDGGPYPGWYMSVWVTGSSPADWIDEEILEQALDISRSRANEAQRQLDEEDRAAAADSDADEAVEGD
jgi:hypothetical protein